MKRAMPGEMGGGQLCSGGAAGAALLKYYSEGACQAEFDVFPIVVTASGTSLPRSLLTGRATRSSGSTCSAHQGPSEVRGIREFLCSFPVNEHPEEDRSHIWRRRIGNCGVLTPAL